LRRRYTKKTHLTFKQILEIDVLPIKSKSGLQRWIDEGVIKSDEIYKTTSGVRKIATSFLVRNDYL
ncbi:hypothetical protein, partial [Pseudoalteromonas fuliginea]|uniref:hypothetical protein n=3 Tax=Pseudomonadati TaxID=3379134 RepID=UPI00197E8709